VRRLDHTIGPAKIVIENNDRFINQLFWRTTSYHRKFLFLLLERDLTNSKLVSRNRSLAKRWSRPDPSASRRTLPRDRRQIECDPGSYWKYGRATAAFVGSDLDQACCQFAHPAQPPQICQAINKRGYAPNLANARSGLSPASKIRKTDSNRHSRNLRKFALFIARLAASHA
jgi:hypothetical protein